MKYVMGAVIPVPTAKRDKYMAHARVAAEIFRDHGAESTAECWGYQVPEGEVTSFPLAVQAKPDETVVLSWVIWPSKEAHDKGMAGVMQDPRMQSMATPFDGQRMIFGSFELVFGA